MKTKEYTKLCRFVRELDTEQREINALLEFINYEIEGVEQEL